MVCLGPPVALLVVVLPPSQSFILCVAQQLELLCSFLTCSASIFLPLFWPAPRVAQFSRIADLEKEIQKNSIPVDETLEKDILSILADSGENEVTPHMRVFWEQQRKLLATPKFGRRYHPHVIRFCLSIHAKSPAAYRELRDSGVLVLPSERTLRDYRNFFKPRAGFHPDNIERLRNQTSQYLDIQRYVDLSFDEMKIQSKLVFDKHSNELIGFVDLGEEELNTSSFGSSDLASHALVFFVRCCH